MSNDARLHELSNTYVNAIGHVRWMETGHEAGDNTAITAALDQAEAAEREAAGIVADTAVGAAAQVAISRDVAGVMDDNALRKAGNAFFSRLYSGLSRIE